MRVRFGSNDAIGSIGRGCKCHGYRLPARFRCAPSRSPQERALIWINDLAPSGVHLFPNQENPGVLTGGVAMSCYRVSFFKTLLSSDGHPFKCLQQRIDIRDVGTANEAADHASKTLEALHHVPDWTLVADSVEVTAADPRQ
jgi:hypothetical protein